MYIKVLGINSTSVINARTLHNNEQIKQYLDTYYPDWLNYFVDDHFETVNNYQFKSGTYKGIKYVNLNENNIKWVDPIGVNSNTGDIVGTADPIKYCEVNFPEMCKEFKAIQQKQFELLCKKQMDYGPGNIAMGTNLSNDNQIMASIKGIIVRANDKMQRLVNLILINNREPTNESVEDTFMDLAVYSTIAMVVRNKHWGK